MRILYLGDIMGELGIKTVETLLPPLRADKNIDIVIAQLENLSNGKGIKPADFARVRAAGVDAGSGGNWSLFEEDAIPLLEDMATPLVRPANYPAIMPGKGYVYVNGVLVISLLGHIVGKDAAKPTNNPLKVVDEILQKEADTPKKAIVVNLHGDYSSEKLVIGHYLNGRATIVVGDHWHIPTNDAQILSGGTAHQTDVGMCGSLDSCLGVRFDIIETRWRDGIASRNELEMHGRCQLNGLLVSVDDQGKATDLEVIRQIV